MSPVKSLVILLLCFCGILADFDEKPSEELRFEHESYAVAVKEFHKLAAKILRIKATGCSDDIMYSIVEPNMPFKIHPTKGKISITENLDFDKKSAYDFHVRAQSAKKNCAAFTSIRVDILKVNMHRPTLNAKRYLCQVVENSRSVKIYPAIEATDKDSGRSGEIAAIHIVTENVPFLIKQDDEGKWQMIVTEDLDAEKVTGYIFNIVAQDNGEIPKKSNESEVHCEVVDVNEFAPKFKQNKYITTISTGKVYDPVIKVEATDEDVDAHFGRVCEYTILDDVPFTINHTGYIKLSKPLDMDAPENFVFAIEARDCGGMTSKNNAMVTIIVDKVLTPTFNKENHEETHLTKCLENVKIFPHIELSEAVKKNYREAEFTALVKMSNKNDPKVCDHDSYDAASLYKLCGTSGVIDLLPPRGPGHEWMDTVKEGEGAEGNLTAKFDGKSAIEVPDHMLPESLGRNFTLATWIRTLPGKEDQMIISSSDRRRLDRLHFALYTTPAKHLVLVHRLENEDRRTTYCKSEFHWKPQIFDNQWHHIGINLDLCEVKMYLDGEYQEAVEFKSNWPLHNSHVPVRVVIGARWRGREMSYGDFFEGELSGLVIRPNKMTNKEVFSCIMGCREMLGINTVIPDTFTVTTEDHTMLKIAGHGTPQQFENLLQNVAYANSRSLPTPGERDVSVVAMINKNTIPTAMGHVVIDDIIKPTIKLSGCDTASTTIEELKSVGKTLCKMVEVNIDMCSHHLDMARIIVYPSLSKDESLVFPSTILDDYRLSSHSTPNGIIVQGVASYKAYERLLRELVYVNTKAEEHTQKIFKISVSDMNGRLKSNEMLMELNIVHSNLEKTNFHKANFIDQTMDSEVLPGAVAVETAGGVATNSASSGMVAIIIIASTCIFVFLVVIGVYRLRKTADKRTLQVATDENEIEWDYAGEGMNITVNPMQKFEELDLTSQSDDDGNDTDQEGETREEVEPTTRMEWDNSIGI